MVSKAVARDTLHYRKLTDKPKDEEKEESENGEKPVEKVINWRELAMGNRRLLPVFEGDEISKVRDKTAGQGEKCNSNDGEKLKLFY